MVSKKVCRRIPCFAYVRGMQSKSVWAGIVSVQIAPVIEEASTFISVHAAFALF